MNAATLRDKIEIYEMTTTRTDYGTIKESYTLKYTTRANTKFVSENQVVSEGEVYYPITMQFIVRAYVPVVETDYIKFDNKKWRILSIDKNKYYNDISINTTLMNE
jgi:head-tail adaptor